MFTEILKAVLMAGVPIAISSYLLVWWALKNDYLGAVDNPKGVEKEFKRLSKARSKNKKKPQSAENDSEPGELRKINPVHNKWLSFGGGFYGLVGLLTYALVELGEVRDFVANFGGFFAMISNISLDLFIGFFVDSLMNFVTAIAWPAYWLNEIPGEFIWIWFAVAYFAYWAGLRFALHQVRQITP